MIARLTGLAFAGVFAMSATAADPTIADFAGQWVGKVTVETVGPTEFPHSVRDSGVTVTPGADGGFTLEWSTVKRETGDPDSPSEKAQDTQIAFTPSGERRWRGPAADAAKGEALWHARLDGATLTVTGFALVADGGAELQTYRRTLEDGAMALSYTRVVDGEVTRRASGALVRFAE